MISLIFSESGIQYSGCVISLKRDEMVKHNTRKETDTSASHFEFFCQHSTTGLFILVCNLYLRSTKTNTRHIKLLDFRFIFINTLYNGNYFCIQNINRGVYNLSNHSNKNSITLQIRYHYNLSNKITLPISMKFNTNKLCKCMIAGLGFPMYVWNRSDKINPKPKKKRNVLYSPVLQPKLHNPSTYKKYNKYIKYIST